MKTARMLAILVLALGLATICLAEEGTWTKKADMPTATSLHSASVVDGKIYVIGGTDNLYGWADYWSTVEVYDPATDTWTKKADMPTGRARLSTSVVDGKIYAIGGSPHRDAEVSTVEVYDPATDTWTKKTDMPRARNWLSTSLVNGKIYAIGGKIYPSATMVSTVEEYDPTTDTWTKKADMPTARGQHFASVVDGKIYVIGVVTGNFGPFISTVEAYDPATDTWARKADMPTSRSGHSASVVDGKIYAVGGVPGFAPALSTVEVYDPATDSWAKEPDMPTARGCHSASVVDGKIYVIGGVLDPRTWEPCFSTVEVYDPSPLVVDFNGDGIVDCADMCIIIAHWHTDEPAYDIAPAPFDDGIVDVQDLIVLADHLMTYPGAVAYWKLDEIEGTVAYDSAGTCDGRLLGNPVWQPAGGMVDGALQLDGVDDCAITASIPNPTEGPFSVFVWVKGGAPGQAVLSQAGGSNWLCADPSEGNLMTELKGTGRDATELLSQTIITDGNWHRIGLVWDGSQRTLYVDDIAVAQDAQPDLEASENGLYIGTGRAMEQGSFWSGLIDDVRIYNRAVIP